MLWHAEVLARHLDPTNIAAAENLPTPQHAAHLSIQAYLRELVQGLTVTLSMMLPALLLAKLTSIPSSFVPSTGR